MDTADVKLMNHYAKFEKDQAKRRILQEVKTLRSYLDDIERAVERDRAPSGEPANMVSNVARISEEAGRLLMLERLSDWVKT